MLKSFMLILPIMICVLTGYAAKKMNLLNEESNAVMGKIVFYIAVPCILFRSLQKLKAAEMTQMPRRMKKKAAKKGKKILKRAAKKEKKRLKKLTNMHKSSMRAKTSITMCTRTPPSMRRRQGMTS